MPRRLLRRKDRPGRPGKAGISRRALAQRQQGGNERRRGKAGNAQQAKLRVRAPIILSLQRELASNS
jgi:hypothetical protein